MDCSFQQDDYNETYSAKYAKDEKSIDFTEGNKKYSSKKMDYVIRTLKSDYMMQLINEGYAKTRKSNKGSGVEISLTTEGRAMLEALKTIPTKRV